MAMQKYGFSDKKFYIIIKNIKEITTNITNSEGIPYSLIIAP